VSVQPETFDLHLIHQQVGLAGFGFCDAEASCPGPTELINNCNQKVAVGTTIIFMWVLVLSVFH